MPYGKKLTDTEIAARMVELRNLRQLHAHDRKQIAALKLRVKTLEQEKADDRAYFESLIQKQSIQIAELQTMVFGKKQPPMGGTPIGTDLIIVPKQPRTPASYRRPVPPASAVTTEVAVPLPAVCVCGGGLDPASVTVHERYEEDIPLPELTPSYQARLVTKYVIERGRCLACGKAATGGQVNLGGQAVTLGPNVRLLVAHLVSVLGMSYTQVAKLLLSRSAQDPLYATEQFGSPALVRQSGRPSAPPERVGSVRQTTVAAAQTARTQETYLLV
ncbi:MAG: hypothetical protein AAB834_01090, partial [Patescibacteria group bacterium]